MKTLVINGSPRKQGNTMGMVNTLLKGIDYDVLHLVDYKIYPYGQYFNDDQFEEVIDQMKDADRVVLGSPVYWHNLSGSVRNFLDRFYGAVDEGLFVGKKLYLIYQGAAPEKWMLDAGEYTISRFCKLYGFEYMGMASNNSQVRNLSKKL